MTKPQLFITGSKISAQREPGGALSGRVAGNPLQRHRAILRKIEKHLDAVERLLESLPPAPSAAAMFAEAVGHELPTKISAK